MRAFINICLCYLISLGMSYIVVALVQADANPANWEPHVRNGVPLIAIAVFIVVGFLAAAARAANE